MGQCTSSPKQKTTKAIPSETAFPNIFYFDPESGVHYHMTDKNSIIARALNINPGTRLSVHALVGMLSPNSFIIVGGFDSLEKKNTQKVFRVNIETHAVYQCAELPYSVLGGRLHIVKNLVFLVGAKEENYTEKVYWPGHANPFVYQWVVAKSPGLCPIWVYHNKLNKWSQVHFEPYMMSKCKRSPDMIYGAGHGLINGKIYFIGGMVQDKEGIWKSNRKIYTFHIDSRYVELVPARFKNKHTILVPKVSNLGNKQLLVAGGLVKDDEGIRPSTKVFVINILVGCSKIKNLEPEMTLLSNFESFRYKNYSVHVDFPFVNIYDTLKEIWSRFDIRNTPLQEYEYEQIRPKHRLLPSQLNIPSDSP